KKNAILQIDHTNYCLQSFHALGPQLIRVIDLKNRVLLDNAEEQQQSQTREDVYRLSGDEQRQDPKRYCQRQRQQDRNWVNERLKLGRQDHVHEDKRQHEGEHEVVSGTSQFL